MSDIREVCRDPSGWPRILEEVVKYKGMADVIMDLESICAVQVKEDPDHATYWAVMGYRLGSIVYPPQVMFDAVEPPIPGVSKAQSQGKGGTRRLR